MSENTLNKIVSGLSDIDYRIYNVVLSCNKDALIDRWKNDNITEWRNNDNLNIAIKSIDDFNNRTECLLIDTSNLSVDMVAERVIAGLTQSRT
jgi:hypothetical protein